MIWSETSTANTGTSLLFSSPAARKRSSNSIIDHRAEHLGLRREQPRQLLRQVAKRDRGRQQRVERRLGQKLDRPGRPARGGGTGGPGRGHPAPPGPKKPDAAGV